MAGDENEREKLLTKIVDLETKLAETKQELERSQQELDNRVKSVNRLEKQLVKSGSYNEDLCQQIAALSREIQTYRDKKKDRQDTAVQAVFEDIVSETGDKPLPEWERKQTTSADSAVQESVDPSASIAETLRQTAEETLSQSGFVFDENSGLYYDYNSGYYYNCEQGLYYDPGTGTYFYYDEASGEYQFHSQVAPQQYSCSTVTPKGHTASRTTNTCVKQRKKEKRRSRGEIKEERNPKARKQKTDDTEESRSKRNKKKRHRESKHKRKKSKQHKKSKSDDISTSENSIPNKEVNKDEVTSEINKINNETVKVLEECRKYKGKEESEDESDELSEGEVLSDSSCDSGESELDSDSVNLGESELESGEISMDSTNEVSDEEEEDEEMDIQEQEGDAEDVSAEWPPCVRAMVTDSDSVAEGTLFIIPCTGGTVGREKNMNHLVHIPDMNVSKVHAQIYYDYNQQSYLVADSGSQNGTYLNGARISQAKSESCGYTLSHCDVLQVGNTQLLMHIHPGSDTCDDCEPGQVLGRIRAQEKANKKVIIKSKAERVKEQRQQLKQIKKKYALENCTYVDNSEALNNPVYTDKASVRRRDVGSDNPYVLDEAPASVMKPISTQNKGHKLLAKMGWKEGQGLGKDSSGIAEPINVTLRTNQVAGLGSGLDAVKSLDDAHSANKSQRWLHAQQRYNKLDAKPVDLGKPRNMTMTFKKGQTILKPRVDLDDPESPPEVQDESD